MVAALISGGDAHGIVVWVAGSLIAASVIGLCAYGIRAMKQSIQTSQDVRQYIVPHFRPPTATEITNGKKDRTLPTRIGDLEEAVDGHAARISRLEKSGQPHYGAGA